MTKIKFRWIFRFLLIALFCPCFSVFAAPSLPPVSVTVSQSNVPGGVQYQYQIRNNSQSPITSIVIGYNYFSGLTELKTAPAGWTASAGIPSSSVNSPNGWTAVINPLEDSNTLQLAWSVSSSGSAIQPNQTVQGFSVLVPAADTSYAESHWTVYLDSAKVSYFSGSLSQQAIPCDNPRLSVSLSPNIIWPPNHKLIVINASISAQDDNYPKPTIKLVSITANEPLKNGDVVASFGTATQTFQVKSERTGKDKGGRVYTVTYSATNSCGHSTNASETITVPHDQGK